MASKELEFALDVCKRAGALALKHFTSGIEMTMKPDNTPVTLADKECEDLIRNEIKAIFPNDAILGEEEGESGNCESNSRKWIIDPIDGTYNFARGIPIFSVLLALEIDGKIKVGVVHNPATGDAFYAQSGFGAYKNGERLKVSKVEKIEDSLFLFGGPNRILKEGLWDGFTRCIEKSYRQRGLGDYLNFAYVFEGKGEATIEVGLYPWDLAPMKVLVEEAGGKFTDLDGGDSIYTGSCLVSNGRVHDAYLRLLKNP